MDALTIQEAAQTTGWSARMLRYIERVGLVAPARSTGGYRLYGPPELQRLRTLRELLERFEVALTDVGFALRLRREPPLRAAVDGWLDDRARRPADVPADGWLRYEQDKHQRLLADARRPVGGDLASATDHLAGPADHLAGPADHLAGPTDHLASPTDRLASATDGVGGGPDRLQREIA